MQTWKIEGTQSLRLKHNEIKLKQIVHERMKFYKTLKWREGSLTSPLPKDDNSWLTAEIVRAEIVACMYA